jgi:hypothetical protein
LAQGAKANKPGLCNRAREMKEDGEGRRG